MSGSFRVTLMLEYWLKNAIVAQSTSPMKESPMQSSDQTTEATDTAEEAPASYHCLVVAQLHAREKLGKNKRPVRKLLGKRTNAILDKHGLRRVIPNIEMVDTECTDDKYQHYTVMIKFETDEQSDALMNAVQDLRVLLISAVRPLFFSTNQILEANLDVQQNIPVQLTSIG